MHFFKVGSLYPEGPGEPQEIQKSGNVTIRLEGGGIKVVSSKRGSQIPLHQISRRAFKIHIPRHAPSTLQSWRWNSAFYLFFIIILIANFPPYSLLFIYFWLHWVIIALPGLSLEAVCGLLTEVASLVVEHRLWSLDSVVVMHWISCPAACGIFPDQESNLGPGAPEKSGNLHFK